MGPVLRPAISPCPQMAQNGPTPSTVGCQLLTPTGHESSSETWLRRSSSKSEIEQRPSARHVHFLRTRVYIRLADAFQENASLSRL